jgi:primosomal replication protein N
MTPKQMVEILDGQLTDCYAEIEAKNARIAELELEVTCLGEVNRALWEERAHGAPLTFCGFPMREAMTILAIESKRLRDAK